MSASGPQRRPLFLQMYSVQQQGELPGGDAADGNIHPREVTCDPTQTPSPTTGKFAISFFVSSEGMHHGSWRQTPIQSSWRFTGGAMPSNVSATTDAHTQLRLGTYCQSLALAVRNKPLLVSHVTTWCHGCKPVSSLCLLLFTQWVCFRSIRWDEYCDEGWVMRDKFELKMAVSFIT